MDSKMGMNITSTSFPSALSFGLLIFKVVPIIIHQADVRDSSCIEVLEYFCCIYDILKYVSGKFSGFARRNNGSVYVEAAVFVVISYAELLQVSWSYIWLALFPAISIGFILALYNKLHLQNGSQQEGEASAGDVGSGEEIKKAEEQQGHDEEGEASAGRGGGDLRGGEETKEVDDQQEGEASAGDVGSGEEIKKAEEQQGHEEGEASAGRGGGDLRGVEETKEADDQQEGEASAGDVGSGKEIKKEEQGHDEEGEASAGRGGGDLRGGKETKEADDQQEFVIGVPSWMFYILRRFPRADNFAVSMFLLFLSFTLGALTRMMMKLAQTNAAPGGAPASALLRKASLVVLLVAVHAIAIELLGDKVVLFILPELAPLLLWLSVHVDRAKEGAIITADRITISTNPVSSAGAVGVVFTACLAVTMDESIFSWVANAVVSSGVSGLLVFYIVSMISQWRQGQDGKATPCLLEETVELLNVWAKVLLITAVVLLVPTSVAAVRLGLHEQMLTAPAEFFNKYVTTTTFSL